MSLARRCRLLMLALLALCIDADPARADPLRSGAEETALPVITAGREAEVLALVNPYALGAEVAPGFRLTNVDIRPRYIVFVLLAGGGAPASLRLDPANLPGNGAERTASFTLNREAPADPNAAVAVDRLAARVRANDHGTFWPRTGPVTRHLPGAGPAPAAPSGVGTHPLSIAYDGAQRVLGDGMTLGFLALAFIVAHLRRVLTGHRWVVGCLVALLGIGAVVRLALSPETLMNAWAYSRVAPLADRIYHGVFLPLWSARTGSTVYLTDVLFRVDLAIAIATPLFFFAHARYVLGSASAALFATALLAVLPHHVRFSRSDVEFVQSLATSSLAFVVLYTALLDPARRWRLLCSAVLPFLCVATYLLRPENLFFAAVDVAAITLTVGDRAPLRRRLVNAGLILAAAGYALALHVWARYSHNFQGGMSLATLGNALSMLPDPELNTLLNFRITPPGVLVLAVAGGATLFASGQRRKLLYLTGWLLGFFIVHSYVRPHEPAMQARYHMHLITPLLLLAASAWPRLPTLPRWAQAGVGAYLAASPILHRGFIQDVRFSEMLEFQFLTELRSQIPDRCTVLELSPALAADDPTNVFPSRLARVGARYVGGKEESQWHVVNSGLLAKGSPSATAVEALSPAAEAILAAPPECLRVYEGLTCSAARAPGEDIAHVCQALHARLSLRSVDHTDFAARLYDELNAGRLETLPGGAGTRVHVALPNGAPVHLDLLGARSRSDGDPEHP